MTKDEAEMAAINAVGFEFSEDARRTLDILRALGMLKLDEPKSFPQKLRDFIMDARLAQGGAMERMAKLGDVLDSCGLKIVEK
jgi:hypothetical protein